VHHTIEIAVPAKATEGVLTELEALEGVVHLSVVYGASVKPPGDVVTAHVLNREVDAVLVVVARARRSGPVSVSTAEVQSIIDEHVARAIDDDVDESPWEEIERRLRHHGQLNRNFLALMGLGAVIAVAGLVSAPIPQALALAAAGIIAPAFEPVAKLAVGLVRGSWYAVRRALIAMSGGYVSLAVVGALAYLALHALGTQPRSTRRQRGSQDGDPSHCGGLAHLGVWSGCRCGNRECLPACGPRRRPDRSGIGSRRCPGGRWLSRRRDRHDAGGAAAGGTRRAVGGRARRCGRAAQAASHPPQPSALDLKRPPEVSDALTDRAGWWPAGSRDRLGSHPCVLLGQPVKDLRATVVGHFVGSGAPFLAGAANASTPAHTRNGSICTLTLSPLDQDVEVDVGQARSEIGEVAQVVHSSFLPSIPIARTSSSMNRLSGEYVPRRPFSFSRPRRSAPTASPILTGLIRIPRRCMMF
jgi:hypothetical protein